MKINIPDPSEPWLLPNGQVNPVWYEFFKKGQLASILAYVTYSSATPTILNRFNVASLTKNATGDITVNFKDAIDSSPAIVATCVDLSAWLASAPTANNVRIRTGVQSTGSLSDATYVSVVALGDRG